VGGEVQTERNLPRALMLGTTAVIAIYLLVKRVSLLIPIGPDGALAPVAAGAAQPDHRRAGVGLVAIVVDGRDVQARCSDRF